MFKVSILDEYGQPVSDYEDAFIFEVLLEHDLSEKYPYILDSFKLRCPYIHLVDSTGSHFYPLYVYSAVVG